MNLRRSANLLWPFLLFLVIYLGCSPASQQGVQWRRVVRVVDGDTLLLDRNERVRLIGVDTPETVDPRRPVQRFGKEASAFTKRMVEGKKVRLEYDQDRVDRYGRTLAILQADFLGLTNLPGGGVPDCGGGDLRALSCGRNRPTLWYAAALHSRLKWRP